MRLRCFKCDDAVANLWHPHVFVCEIAKTFDYEYHFISPSSPSSWRLRIEHRRANKTIKVFFEQDIYNVFIGNGIKEVTTHQFSMAFYHAYQCALSIQ